MSKHDIRLRRQKLTARGSERFRNYGAVLQQHEEEKRMKKVLRAFTYFFVILIVIILLVIVIRIERRAKKDNVVNPSAIQVKKESPPYLLPYRTTQILK